jgi:hypothetical protein
MPDWSRLHAYAKEPWKSFEELCYQIAFRLFSSEGELTRVDDKGGGDGVEFYLTRSNGQETGWQAKFYYPESRLNPNRKRHITESLVRALGKHPKLKKWILCTPSAFTRGEQDWFDGELQKTARKVQLEHWDASKIDAMLTKPEMVGIKLNFFGTLEFTPEWFRRQVEGQLRNVKDKYDPLLHTEGSADLAAHALLGDRLFLQELAGLREKYDQYYHEFVELGEKARSASFDARLRDECQNVLDRINEIGGLLSQGQGWFSSAGELAQAGRVEAINIVPISNVIDEIRSATRKFYEAADALVHANHRLPAAQEADEKKRNDEFDSSYRRLSGAVTSCVDDLVDFLHSFLHLLRTYSSHSMHFLGNAGVGKTHLTCNLSAQRIQRDLPAVLLLGRDFSPGTTLKNKLLEICDIPSSYSFEDFLAALDSYAFSRRTKAVLAIDALNESKTPVVWADGLGDLESRIERRSRVALLTTCRPSYLEPIWGTEKPKNVQFIDGFVTERVEEAAQKYFDHYKIQATLTSASLAFFRSPLFLKIFCEGQNPERRQLITVHIGEQSFLSIFDTFLETVNSRVSQKLSKAPLAKITQNRLVALAKDLWATNSRSVSFERAVLLLDKLPIDEVNWENSLTKSLEQEGLLIEKDWEPQSGTQRVSFTYDLLGGYLLAQATFEGMDRDGARAFVKSSEFESRLLGDDFQKLHPISEDVLRCAAVLLPDRFQLYVQSEVPGLKALNSGIRALFEMGPSNVREINKRELQALFDTAHNRMALLDRAGETAMAVNHPLNWEFWSGLLKGLPTAERDESWAELVRRNADSIVGLISKVERECRNSLSFSDESKRRLKLAAEYLSWFLISTHRGVRDSATKALYWYGRRFPRELFTLTLASFQINDSYVRERLVAAGYGVAMALYRSEGTKIFCREIFPEYAKALYKAVFAPDAKCSTTHALIRDYAKHTLDLALLMDPNLLTAEELQKIAPPYQQGGIRRLHKGKDKNAGQYRDGNKPLGMDFHNYTLGRLIPDRGNYDYQDPLFKKVESHIWWRIYDLGYSLERFGEVDKEIARRRYLYSSSSADEGGVDRYGKKYAWIAFFEIFGLFQDRGILPLNWIESEARPSDVDIEPSFPETPEPVNSIGVSFLEPKEMSAREWVAKGPKPDINSHLTIREISDEQGPWVLLDGSLAEEDEGCDHRITLRVTALIVHKGHAERLVETKKKSITQGYWMPKNPESYYSFIGEMPWCESIPENGWTDLGLLMMVRRRVESKREVTRRLKSPVINVVFPGLGKAGRRIRVSGPSTHSRKPQEIDEPITEKFEVLLPTRSMTWESYHTRTSEGQGPMLAKDLAGPLGLWVDLPSTDFRDSKGRRATFTCDWGDSPHRNHGRFVYIRQDLLDHYLEVHRLECVWGLWGERNHSFKTHQEHAYGGKIGDPPDRVTFQDCWQYPLK